MNLVLAIVLHTVVFAVGVKVPAYELAPAVVGVVADGFAGRGEGTRARRPDRLDQRHRRRRGGATPST